MWSIVRHRYALMVVSVVLAASFRSVVSQTSQKDAENVIGIKQCDDSSEYFDEISMQCYPCATDDRPNLVPDLTSKGPYGALSCTCQTHFYRQYQPCSTTATTATCIPFLCVECNSGEGATEDQSRCMQCAGSNASAASSSVYDNSRKQCSCAKYGSSYRLVSDNEVGDPLQNMQCVRCPKKTVVKEPTVDPFTCYACPHPNMTYDVTTKRCSCESNFQDVDIIANEANSCLPKDKVLSGVLTTSHQITYNSVQEDPTKDWRDAFNPLAGTTTSTTSGGGTQQGSSTYTLSKASLVFKQYYTEAASRCTFFNDETDLRYCQTLVNLCALLLYDTTKSACNTLEKIVNSVSDRGNPFSTNKKFQNWKRNTPKYKYEDPLRPTQNNDMGPNMKMSLDAQRRTGTADHLNFRLAKYAINGSLVGIEMLTTQMYFCNKKSAEYDAGGALNTEDTDTSGSTTGSTTSSTTPTYGPPPSGDTRWLKHGHSYREAYWCDLASLMEDDEETYFYDIYLLDSLTSTDSDMELYPLPVRIINIEGNLNDIVAPTREQPSSTWTLYRRFFLKDTISGVTSLNEKPEIIRYADYISIETTIRSDPTQIYLPLVSIHYAERKVPLDGALKTDKLEFEASYTTNMVDRWTAYNYYWAFTFVFGLVYGGFRVGRSCRRVGQTSDTACGGFMIRAISYVYSSWAFLMFWLIFLISFGWFVVFKGQSAVATMVPPVRIWWGLYDNYNPFRWMLWLCFFGQACRIAEILVEQCRMEMFFIDWEKSRGKLGGGAAKRAGGSSSKVPVSAWRTLFVANEWNELQSCRITNFNLTLVTTVFFLVGCDMQYLATSAPQDTTPGPLNPMLRFANTTMWLMIAEVAQLLWNWLIWRRCFREPKSQQFHDFCTMAKISVFLLPDKLHGYYLHARSPHEHADSTMLQIAKDLKKQEDNLVLEDPMPDVPTIPGGQGPMYSSFELYLTRKFRKHYDDIFSSIRADEQRAARMSGNSKSEGLSLLKRSSLPTEATDKANRRLTKFLKGFIDKTDNVHRNEFQPSNYMYRAFHWPTLTSEDVSFIYGDAKAQTMGFTQPRWTMVTFLGCEYDLFIFNVLTFAVIDLWVGDNLYPGYHAGAHLISAFVTYLMEMLVRYLRDTFGAMNVNEKTLVDDRFLL